MKKLTTVLNWLLVIIWMGVIFYFSSLPDLKSELPNFWDLVFRKLAHFSEYFVLTYFLIKALLGHRIKKKTVLLVALLLAFSYAISDEYHQTFTLGRSGRFEDVLIDSVGILLMTIMYQRIK